MVTPEIPGPGERSSVPGDTGDAARYRSRGKNGGKTGGQDWEARLVSDISECSGVGLARGRLARRVTNLSVIDSSSSYSPHLSLSRVADRPLSAQSW